MQDRDTGEQPDKQHTDKQTDKQTKSGKNITSLAEVNMDSWPLFWYIFNSIYSHFFAKTESRRYWPNSDTADTADKLSS